MAETSRTDDVVIAASEARSAGTGTGIDMRSACAMNSGARVQASASAAAATIGQVASPLVTDGATMAT
jgi:hypothetical protein